MFRELRGMGGGGSWPRLARGLQTGCDKTEQTAAEECTISKVLFCFFPR